MEQQDHESEESAVPNGPYQWFNLNTRVLSLSDEITDIGYAL